MRGVIKTIAAKKLKQVRILLKRFKANKAYFSFSRAKIMTINKK